MKKFLFLFAFAPFILAACSHNTVSDTGPRPYLGNADAPVLIEEFSDLQCPACAQISPQVERFTKENPTVARMYYYHFPLPQHQNALPAAEAAECAADQGKFWDYIGLAFANQANLSDSVLKTIAGTLKLDEAAFIQCLDGRDKKPEVLADLAEGRRRGVNATPTFYVNGQPVRFSGYEPFSEYVKGLAASAQ